MTALLGIGAMAVLGLWPGVSWPAIKARIAKEFPDVQSLGTAELAKMEPKPVLLDVRTAAEFGVSRIAGAQRVDPEAATVALPKDTQIVTYCSVGYRSAKFAQRLQAAGFTKVRNLDGSIFQWANEGRPLAGGAGKVHPFNKKWGALLDAARRSE